jgi:hypothetical protein
VDTLKFLSLGWGQIVGILEVGGIMIDVGPHRNSFLLQVVGQSFSLVVAQKGPVFAGVNLISNECEHLDVELEHGGHLDNNHADQIKELYKNWTSLIVLVVFVVVSKAFREHVPEREPVLLDENLETLDRAVPPIQK